MWQVPQFDAALLSKYDRSGPRYTSYPTAPQFSPAFGELQFREALQRSNAMPAKALSIYVHVPYCRSPCFYCGCNRIITRDHSRSGPYLARLAREIEAVGEIMDGRRQVLQMHFGGGTPNFLSAGELRQVVDHLRGAFTFADPAAADVSIELDPRWIADGDIAALADAGFNRASFGVQDLDPRVQRAVNRIQSEEQTLRAIADCRANGFRSVNVDLIYGLPEQTEQGFARTLDVLIAARPDRLAVYGYAHLPQLFKGQRQIDAQLLPSPGTKLQLLGLAISRLTAAGYRYVGMDPFALPQDELAKACEDGTLTRNFMGYSTHGDTDLIGFGVSAISQIADCISQNARDLPEWESMLEAGHLPVKRGIRLDRDDLIRADAIRSLMCHGRIDTAALEQRHGVNFPEYFQSSLTELAPLVADGLVQVSDESVSVTSRGRLLLRIVAACFDRYLARDAEKGAPVRYSKVV